MPTAFLLKVSHFLNDMQGEQLYKLLYCKYEFLLHLLYSAKKPSHIVTSTMPKHIAAGCTQ